MLYKSITDSILAAFYEVYRPLGAGFLEKVYENALLIELRQRGLEVAQQVPIPVRYKGVPVGEYYADLLVAQKVIVEIKAVERLTNVHEAQLLHYLKATDKEVGLLLNFGPKPQIIRRIWTNDRKPNLSPQL
ncbi:MAG: GxxExxY protein [Chloroflexi bacterium]|nr:GxxExxY protein [Chloroflexota bacterium]